MQGGEYFHFGDNGLLMCIRPLGNGQILAKWSSWEIREGLKRTFYGERSNREYIRPEKGGSAPVYVLVRSSKVNKQSLPSTGSDWSANKPRIHRYKWVSTSETQPRYVSRSVREQLAPLLSSWLKGEPKREEPVHFDGWEETLALIASLPSGEHMR
jgi:hypothetical protein